MRASSRSPDGSAHVRDSAPLWRALPRKREGRPPVSVLLRLAAERGDGRDDLADHAAEQRPVRAARDERGAERAVAVERVAADLDIGVLPLDVLERFCEIAFA